MVSSLSPNIPEVQSMWAPGANHLKAVLAGSEDAATAAATLVTDMKTGIEQSK